uniref:Uncharacterized protein n=1 Tax=Anguilla anguilla TaxID=7936 RepID=A0A0E9UBB2_ANGAN
MWLHELGGASADVTMAGRSVIDFKIQIFLTCLGRCVFPRWSPWAIFAD